MKNITMTDKARIEKILKGMKSAGLNAPQLELLEVNIENLIAEKNIERTIKPQVNKVSRIEDFFSKINHQPVFIPWSELLGKDISTSLSEEEVLLQRDEAPQFDNCQKCDESTSETPAQKFLNAVKSGNIECQKHTLSNLYKLHRLSRKRIGGRVLPRSLFLSEAQRFVESQGLIFDKRLHKMNFDK